MRDIGNMDAQQIMPIAQFPDAHCIIKVLRLFTINGNGGPVSVIGPPRKILRPGLSRQSCRLGQCLAGEFFEKVMLVDNNFYIDARLILIAQYFSDFQAGPVNFHNLSWFWLSPVFKLNQKRFFVDRIQGENKWLIIYFKIKTKN